MASRSASQVPLLRDAPWLRAGSTQAVLSCLVERGFRARVVGGAVRNALMGRTVADVDIATDARPTQVLAAAADAGLKTLATGLQHGTVTVIALGQPFEVTTLRRDVETDGRHAVVAFTDDWTADASRRDLTLNALYCDADGTLFDPLGGLDDLRAGHVRFIGDPHARIAEDYLRILRFFRFTAEYADGAPDGAGLAAAVAARAGLQSLSAERVRAELLRLMVARRAIPVVETMAAHGLLTAILPVAPRLGVLSRLAAIETTQALAPSAVLRLAALAIVGSEDAQRLSKLLRLSGTERDVLQRAAETAPAGPGLDEVDQRAALYRLGRNAFRERILLSWAQSDAAADDSEWQRVLGLPDCWQAPDLPVSGQDLLDRGLAPGPRIGRILAAFEAWWIAEAFPNDRPRIDAALQAIIGKS